MTGHRNTGTPSGRVHSLIVAESVFADAGHVMNHEGDQGQAVGEPEYRERREHEQEERPEQVVDEDEAEQGDQVEDGNLR